MKKILLSFAVMAVGLLMTGCSDNTFNAEPEGELANVSFTLDLDGSSSTKGAKKAPARKAISDGLASNRLVYAVFDAAGNRVTGIAKVDKAATFPCQENITLAKGQTYKIAFWAQNSATSAYTLDDNMNVTVDYTGDNNDDTRDAFFKTVDVTVTGDAEVSVVMKRPFAQLNLGTTTADYDAAVTAGFDLAKSSVVIKNAANKLNLVTGKAEGDVEVSYALADMPAENLTVNSVAYKYLSMSYLLVNDGSETGAERANLTSAAFVLKNADSSKELELSDGLNNIPVQRNWRTNILSEGLLSGNIKFNIEIDPTFEGDIDFVQGIKGASGATYETLAEAINAQETEITLGNGEYPLASTSVKTPSLKITGVSTDAKIKLEAKQVNMNGADVTFENLTVVSINDNYVGFTHANTHVFNNCVIENVLFCYTADKTTFNNCTFNQTNASYYNVWTYATNVDFNSCTFNCAGKAALVYSEGAADWCTENFNNCTFNASSNAAGKSAIEIDSSLCKYIVNINGCTDNGFAAGSKSGLTLYNLKNGTEGENCVINVTE